MSKTIYSTRTCTKCESTKPIEDFSSDFHCKECISTYKRNYYNTPETKQKYWERSILKKFGLTPQQYQEMFDLQNGRCKICNTHQSELKQRLSVDHNHKTGKVRSLLCNDCNTGIGLLKESVDILQTAILYINSDQ